MSSTWILNNLKEYIISDDVHLRHGWFEIKIEGVLNATEDIFRSQVMDEIENIIADPYFEYVSQLQNGTLTESQYWSNVARYTDAFQILRNLRSKYDLPKSNLLNP